MATKPKEILKKKYKATQETLRIIFDAILSGLTQRDAAALAGISEDTLSLWKKDSDFSEQIRGKEIQYKQSLLQGIKEAGKKDWRADAWLLERKFRDEFTPKNDISFERKETIEELASNIKSILTPKSQEVKK